MPHLGASSEESEENCAMMAAQEVSDYLLQGNVKNSVNLPDLTMEWQTDYRLCILYRNECDCLAKATALLQEQGVSVQQVASRDRGSYGYLLADCKQEIPAALTEVVAGWDCVLRVRSLRR